MPVVFRKVSKRFGDLTVLDEVDLEIRDGELFFIVGPSGAGKSVLIKQLIGLIRPDSGEIFFDDLELSQLSEEEFFDVRKRCAMVFQNSTLLDFLTCAENVALPLRKHKLMSPRAALTEAYARLELLHIRQYADVYPGELGMGIQKRVAIARALALDPRYVLFDEPTTGLDPVSARRVDALIRELSDLFGVTAIVVSHDLESMFSIADRIALLYRSKIRLVGTPKTFRQSEDDVVRQFINGRADGPMALES